MPTRKTDVGALLKMDWKRASEALHNLLAKERSERATRTLLNELAALIPDSDGDVTDLVLRAVKDLADEIDDEDAWLRVAEATVSHRSAPGALRAIRILDEACSYLPEAQAVLGRVAKLTLAGEVRQRLLMCAVVAQQPPPKATPWKELLEVPSGKLVLFDLLEPFSSSAGPWELAGLSGRVVRHGDDLQLVFAEGGTREDAPVSVSIEHVGPALADVEVFAAIEANHAALSEQSSDLADLAKLVSLESLGLSNAKGHLLVWAERGQQPYSVAAHRNAQGRVTELWLRARWPATS